jgi:cyclic pyranopterin phosphate synthase
VFEPNIEWFRAHPNLKKSLEDTDLYLDLAKHSIARKFPGIVKPEPRKISISLTSNCNLRCDGCNYGRDYMSGNQLPEQLVYSILDDTKRAGFLDVQFYGGEPLLYKNLDRLIEYSLKLELPTHIITNGLLLRKKIDRLYEVGLRHIGIGMYGIGDRYDQYVQRKGAFKLFEEGLIYARKKYGMDLKLSMMWLLTKATCNKESLYQAWDFAHKYSFDIFSVSPIHYSFPYFTTESDLHFDTSDRPKIEEVLSELIKLKKTDGSILQQSLTGLHSLPDWLLLGPQMRIPCIRYQMLWIGPDGSVSLCPAMTGFGNVYQNSLAEILDSTGHRCAAQKSIEVKCSNCVSYFDERIQRDYASRKKYKSRII